MAFPLRHVQVAAEFGGQYPFLPRLGLQGKEQPWKSFLGAIERKKAQNCDLLDHFSAWISTFRTACETSAIAFLLAFKQPSSWDLAQAFVFCLDLQILGFPCD